MTDVKSSSLMRSSRPSLVMPALDTSTSTGPNCCLDCGERGVDARRRRDVALTRRTGRRAAARVVGDGDLVAERGEALRAGQADASRAAGDEDRRGSPLVRRPSAARRWRPSCRRRSRRAGRGRRRRRGRRRARRQRQRDRRRRRVAGVVQHRRRALHRDAEALARGLDDADVGLVGHDQRDLVGGDAGVRSSTSCAESTMMRTARRKTSLPSIWMKPPTSAYRNRSAAPSASRSQPSSWPGPSTASSTTAPEPSANRMAVLRSVQSVIARQRVGADAQHLVGAHRDQAVRHDQPVDEARARGVDVERAAAQAELVGDAGRRAGHRAVGRGGGQHERVDRGADRRPTCRAPCGRTRSTGRWWCRRRGARGCRCARRSTRRDVSNISSRSWLVSTFGGSAVPQPVMTRAADAGGNCRHVRPSSARRWVGACVTRSPDDRDVALQDAGERRADLGVADVAEHRADVDERAVGEPGDRARTRRRPG